MREVPVAEIAVVVEKLLIDANINFSMSVRERLERAVDEEVSPAGKEVLRDLLKNAESRGTREYPYARTPGWPLSSWKSGRTCSSRAGT